MSHCLHCKRHMFTFFFIFDSDSNAGSAAGAEFDWFSHAAAINFRSHVKSLSTLRAQIFGRYTVRPWKQGLVSNFSILDLWKWRQDADLCLTPIRRKSVCRFDSMDSGNSTSITQDVVTVGHFFFDYIEYKAYYIDISDRPSLTRPADIHNSATTMTIDTSGRP